MKTLLYAATLILLISSCRESFYGPAMYGHDVLAVQKPVYSDTVKSGLYLSGTYSIGAGYNYDDRNESVLGQLVYARSWENASIALGGYGFTGNYFVSGEESNFISDNDYEGNYSYNGVGGIASANFTLDFNKVNFRMIGIQVNKSLEYGKFQDFKDMIATDTTRGFATIGNDNLNVLLTSEIVTKTDPSFSARLFIGKSYGGIDKIAEEESDAYGTMLLGATFSLTSNRFNGYIQVNSQEHADPVFNLGVGYNLLKP